MSSEAARWKAYAARNGRLYSGSDPGSKKTLRLGVVTPDHQSREGMVIPLQAASLAEWLKSDLEGEAAENSVVEVLEKKYMYSGARIDCKILTD